MFASIQFHSDLLAFFRSFVVEYIKVDFNHVRLGVIARLFGYDWGIDFVYVL